MENKTEKYDFILEELNFSNQAENSMKEFSNWIFGISIGISALLLFQIKDFDFSSLIYSKLFYKALIVYSMLNVFFTGNLKFYILKRETRINITIGIMKKLIITSKLKDKTVIKNEWSPIFKKWVKEFNKIKIIGKLINTSIYTTLILILLTSVFILWII